MHQPFTLAITVEVQVQMDLGDIDWYCDPISGEPDLSLIAQEIEVRLSQGEGRKHETHNLEVTDAVAAPVKYRRQ